MILILLAMTTLIPARNVWLDVYCYRYYQRFSTKCCALYDEIDNCLEYTPSHRCVPYFLSDIAKDIRWSNANRSIEPECTDEWNTGIL
jgi:hypothetical protein